LRTCFGSGAGRVVRRGGAIVAVVEGTVALAGAARLADVELAGVVSGGLVVDSDVTSP
jgi:hypothetical protein